MPDHDTRSAAELLTDARALLARPNGWCQAAGKMSRPDDDGSFIDCYDPIGALQQVTYGWDQSPGYHDAVSVMRQCIPNDGIADNYSVPRINRWNDAWERTQDEVLAMIDRAIAACR